jgi:hypothetical protein
MKLSQLAAKPQLIKITIDDENLVATYGGGETIEFWTWDRQPLTVFMKLSAAQGGNNDEMIDVVRTLILDENKNQIITDDSTLPAPIMVKAISLIVERLGK